MKTIKISIGEVGFIETNDTYKNSIKKIPKGWRAIEDYEIRYLWKKEKNELKKFLGDKQEGIWINEKLFYPVAGCVYELCVARMSSGIIVIKKGSLRVDGDGRLNSENQ